MAQWERRRIIISGMDTDSDSHLEIVGGVLFSANRPMESISSARWITKDSPTSWIFAFEATKSFAEHVGLDLDDGDDEDDEEDEVERGTSTYACYFGEQGSFLYAGVNDGLTDEALAEKWQDFTSVGLKSKKPTKKMPSGWHELRMARRSAFCRGAAGLRRQWRRQEWREENGQEEGDLRATSADPIQSQSSHAVLSRHARVIAARELHERTNSFAVWRADTSKLHICAEASAKVPRLAGKEDRKVTTFYLEKHAPTLSDIDLGKGDGGDDGGNGGEPATTLANGETWLSRWCVAVGLHAEMVKALEHARDAYKAVVRAKARREDDRAAQEAAEKRELLKQCHKHGVDPALFPPDDPWGLFPWELQLRPKAEVEERLQKAVGLRQTARLEVELNAAKEMGLDIGSNTKVFAASELLALFLAEGAAMRRSNTAGVHDLGVPMPQRQKTERVVAALHVFLEQVVIDVPGTVPVSVPYKLKLSTMRDAFTPFIGQGEDAARCEGILALVSSSASAAGIETEQEREQEQEQQQEQQREQEVEIERYQDLAYVREGEEPTRWPFCQLAEFCGAAQQPAPLAEGAFYRASEFCVRGKSPLTFPPYLAVSRNHFNLEWRGERRLKNAVMVLEWCPSAKAVQEQPPRVAELSERAKERLTKALNLLDVDGSGDLSRQELIARHSADELGGRTHGDGEGRLAPV